MNIELIYLIQMRKSPETGFPIGYENKQDPWGQWEGQRRDYWGNGAI